MLYWFKQIDLSEGIDVVKSNNSRECIFHHYCYFNHGFKFQNFVCNGCHDLLMLCLNISNVAIFSVTGINFWIFLTLANLKQLICWNILFLMIAGIHKMSFKEINFKNSVYNYYFNYLIKGNVRNIKYFNQWKNSKDLSIYFLLVTIVGNQ